MGEMVGKAARYLGWFIGSAVLTAVSIVVIAVLGDEFRFSNSLPRMELVIIVLLAVYLFATRRFIFKKEAFQTYHPGWNSPTLIRNQVINSPQFQGRLDRDMGLLDATARMVEQAFFTTKGAWSGVQKEYSIIRIRAELLDENGTPLEYIPVEIKAVKPKWVGNIVDGDRFRAEGKFESDGILHVETAFNYSTNSIVGKKQ